MIVRRIPDLNQQVVNGQGELFPVWRQHAALTDSPFVLVQAEAQHRGHAVIEQVFAELIVDAWARQWRKVGRKAARRTVPVLSAAVEQMVPMLDHVGGVYLRNARLAAAFVDFGGSPLPLREVMPRLAAKTLEHHCREP